VRFLRKRLEGMAIVDPLAPLARRDPKRVYFGAWVEIESGVGELRWHRIVGPDEFDMDDNYVSMDSPLGRGLMGKALDDEVTVELPGGAATFTVAAISYTLKPPERS
jgi:transcription elongation factor GreB